MSNIHQEKREVAMLSVLSNALLVAAKLVVGLLIGSVSVLSEAIHSGVDLVASAIALFAVKTSGKPADEEHPYGHGKVENISGTVEAVLIFFAAGWIIYEAVEKLLHPRLMTTPMLGIVVMAVSSGVNFVVSERLFRIGKKTSSAALLADAWHLRTDVYTSVGVMIGLAGIWLGAWIMPGFSLYWLDPVAAILVALLIIKAAYELTIEAGRDLLDTKLPAEEEAVIKHHVAEFAPTVKGFHRMRTRKAGHLRFVDFHIQVEGSMTVDRAHEISHDIARSIHEHYPDSIVNIHVEPYRASK
jgi:cation diffusion facilitator family transporter